MVLKLYKKVREPLSLCKHFRGVGEQSSSDRSVGWNSTEFIMSSKEEMTFWTSPSLAVTEDAEKPRFSSSVAA